MLQRTIYILFFKLISSIAFAQGEANIWYFGSNAGLDFNNGTPVALNNGRLDTTEGCAVISDSSGQLLFYSDGRKVWDRNHQVMPNGTGLLGNDSATQSAVIVPKPNSSGIFYLFTVTDAGRPDGVRFSEVDINLNGGLGDVTQNKNILLLTPACEKITSVKNANGTGFWVVIHENESNRFLAYEITAAGINLSPVVSNVGIVIDGALTPYKTAGYLKFSPNGSKLVSCNFRENVELFDFNAYTGVISNPRIIRSEGKNYGVEFSPSGNLLYITTGGGLDF